MRKHKLFFTLATACAIAFRVFFVLKFRMIDGDSLIYGDIAKNWLTHGVFGVTTAAGPIPTWIRLPGYPALLDAVWFIAGVEHYTAVLLLQVLIDVGTCFVVADIARRILTEPNAADADGQWRAARNAFVFTAFCPFIAVFTAAPLSETAAIFCTALALDAAIAGTDALEIGGISPWVICGIAVAISILLRPDGGILLAVVGVWLGYQLFRCFRPNTRETADTNGSRRPLLWRNVLIAGITVAAVALAPLVPWTARNWRDFRRFQPLAPRYANAPDEPVNYGYQRWTKTWMVDFISVVEVYWQMPDQPIDIQLLPNRAFDSPAERERTEAILNEYNDQGQWTQEMDDALGQIARERIKRSPLRYYVSLPAARIADMWLRPRTELLRINDRWWEYEDDPWGAWWATFLGGINLFYVGTALLALIWRRRQLRLLGLPIGFVLLRSIFLGTLENPETRYTLECYPVVLALAAILFIRPKPKFPTASS